MSDDNKEKKVRDRTKDETGKYNDPELEAEEEQDRRVNPYNKRGKDSKNKDRRVKVHVQYRDGSQRTYYEGGRKSRRKTKRHRRKTKRRRRKTKRHRRKTTHRRKHRVKRRRRTRRR